ncbi:hypothetical protein RhiirA5_430159 [Rhizophagus irregularis]|uniref:Uncharacterized protein n=1 Tax=Rhizophagus irregularis TaxID=588596 RepID=A0A2N0NX86_9GLOM|nr:hypothetical protein RhiirA5_430159 [Rhizophagus irregularis]PKC57229.1 hypothetical protein RhiirA1_472813 [Rhizophagus irregularis]
MDLDKKRDFVKEIDDELDKSLNAGSLQEKSQKDGSNILIAEENQLRAEAEKIDSTENQVEEIYKRFLSRVKEECKNAELAIMNIKEKDILFVNQFTNDLEKKSAGCKEVVYDLEKELNDCWSQIINLKKITDYHIGETMDLDKEGDFAEEIDNELDVTVVFDIVGYIKAETSGMLGVGIPPTLFLTKFIDYP